MSASELDARVARTVAYFDALLSGPLDRTLRDVVETARLSLVTPGPQLRVVPIGYRVGKWQVVVRLPAGSPVWGRRSFGRVWPWSRVLIGNGYTWPLPWVTVQDATPASGEQQR